MSNNGKVRKKGFIKRLFAESLILSCLGRISSRLICFFKKSIFSLLLTGCAISDEAMAQGVAGRFFKKRQAYTRFILPVKRNFSASVEEGVIVRYYRKLLQAVLYTPVRTYGAFFATYGIYVGLIYVVKHYENLSDITVSTLQSSCVIMLLSFPLMFVGKPLISLVGGSTFVSSIFAGYVDFSRFDKEKRPNAIGTALGLGSALGVLTFFSDEKRMLAFLAASVFALAVFHYPELGFFTAALVFPFVSKEAVCVLLAVTLLSYFFKVLRGKRSFRLNSASVFVAMLCISFLFAALRGGEEKAWFAFSMCALYLLAVNLIATPALLRKSITTLALGLGICITVFAVQVFVLALEGSDFFTAVKSSCSVFESSHAFAGYLVLMLPMMFCKANKSGLFYKGVTYLIFVASIAYSVMMKHTALAVLSAVGVTAYLAISTRRVFRPLVLSFGLPIGGLFFSAVPITYTGMGVYDSMAGWASAVAASAPHIFLGVGMSEASVKLVFEGNSCNMFLQILLECGLAGFILLALAVVFAMQRIYGSLSKVGTQNRIVTAASGASALVGFVLACGTNLWNSTELCYIFWLCLGIAGAAYRLRKDEWREHYDC